MRTATSARSPRQILGILVLGVIPACATVGAPPDAHPRVQRADPAAESEAFDRPNLGVDSLIQTVQREIGAPAISVAIAHNGQVAHVRAFGTAELEHAVPATPSTIFRSASVTKPMTAAAVLRLVADGALDLEHSVRRYVPELPETYGNVTLRDLLRHTGGVRHYRNLGEFISTRHCDSLVQALPIFAADSLEHEPGTKITYSSYGYTLLGLAIESVSGMRYADYVDANIFRQAGMTSTRPEGLDIILHRASGYRRTGDGTLRNAPPLDVSCRLPAGGFVSTAEDLARFVAALDSGVLLRPGSVREMTRSHVTPDIIARTLQGLDVPPDYQPPGMGLGWAVAPDGRSVYHGGNQPGFTSMLYYVPERRLGVAVMVNVEGAGTGLEQLARTIAAAYDQPPT